MPNFTERSCIRLKSFPALFSYVLQFGEFIFNLEDILTILKCNFLYSDNILKCKFNKCVKLNFSNVNKRAETKTKVEIGGYQADFYMLLKAKNQSNKMVTN